MFTPLRHSFRVIPAQPMSRREQVSYTFLFAGLILLVVSGVVLGFYWPRAGCWPLDSAVAVCSGIALCFGSWQQRLVAMAMLAVAAIFLVVGYLQGGLQHPPAPPNHALQRTEAGHGVGSEFHA